MTQYATIFARKMGEGDKVWTSYTLSFSSKNEDEWYNTTMFAHVVENAKQFMKDLKWVKKYGEKPYMYAKVEIEGIIGADKKGNPKYIITNIQDVKQRETKKEQTKDDFPH